MGAGEVKDVEGTAARAVDMNSFQVIAGQSPPYWVSNVSSSPSVSLPVTGPIVFDWLLASPSHTAVERVGV